MRTAATARILACLSLLLGFSLACSLSAIGPNVQPTLNVATRAAQTVAALQISTPTLAPAQPNAAPTQAQTLTPIQAATSQPAASPTPTIKVTNTPAPYTTPLVTSASAQNVNLRQGPGTLFPVLERLPQGTPLTILAKARGDDWLYVEAKGKQGWVSTGFALLTVSGKEPIANVPIREVKAAVMVHGKVTDASGKPVDKIGFAIVKNDGSSNPPRVDAYSLDDGSFYFYLPGTAAGNWDVSLVSYDCKSWIMEANCQISGHFEPGVLTITLPYSGMVEFKYVK